MPAVVRYMQIADKLGEIITKFQNFSLDNIICIILKIIEFT
jgi:hypothetical protein